MEEVIFREQPVKGILQERYVEARLHMDADPPFPGHEEVRLKFGVTKTLPNYVTVEPAGEVLSGLHPGAELDSGKFGRWLQEGLDKAGRERSDKAR